MQRLQMISGSFSNPRSENRSYKNAHGVCTGRRAVTSDAPTALALDSHLWTAPPCARVFGMNKGLIWTIVGILLIIALVIWIMQRT